MNANYTKRTGKFLHRCHDQVTTIRTRDSLIIINKKYVSDGQQPAVVQAYLLPFTLRKLPRPPFWLPKRPPFCPPFWLPRPPFCCGFLCWSLFCSALLERSTNLHVPFDFFAWYPPNGLL